VHLGNKKNLEVLIVAWLIVPIVYEELAIRIRNHLGTEEGVRIPRFCFSSETL